MPPNSQRHTRSRSHSQSHAPPQHVSIDPKIWRACAGNSVTIPTLHSRVYYFPQGHLEHSTSSNASPPLLLSPLLLSKPRILCRIAAVDFLADPVTDEVFAKLLLHPVHSGLSSHHRELAAAAAAAEEEVENENDAEDRVLSFAKILTPSDANNGGGFSVPRFCADSIFPPLNYQAEPPVQTLSVTDLHGVVWDFRHIYRGTPRRHLLTTGWSKFVNHKVLVAGDSVVFMRSSRGGDMHVGVRRTVRASPGGDCSRWSSHIALKPEEEGSASSGDGYKAKLKAEAVVEAAEMAAQDRPFEVVYYPKAGWAEFVVKAEVVEKALNVCWMAGMRVKMAMETDDSSRMTWFQGTLSSRFVPENGPWKGSPWRALQVTWDEPEGLQNAKRVSPWQVDFVASTPSLHTAPSLHTVYPPTKRFRAPLNPGLMRNGDEEFIIPMTGAANSTMGHFNASLLNYNIFPAGMQGARQDLFCVPSVSHLNLLNDNTARMCTYNSFGNNNMVPRLEKVSTELNIGSPQSDQLSPDSQRSSPHSSGVELDGNQNCNSTKVGKSSFQLFGQTIPINGTDGTGDGGTIGCNETELLNCQLELSYTKLLEKIDVRVSAVEACTL
ncbi:auxin response factor 17 [Argentina anserina]|uniref:auxin response factor 17 n=1 Tax=Argentina anserina TaxID=57926 RepID=UPI0021762824|nr:auxin response factor 17 [Potentilla anserina]XP_050376497.1 auxin response factor 17 [Potentilla anserina]